MKQIQETFLNTESNDNCRDGGGLRVQKSPINNEAGSQFPRKS